MFFFPLLLVPKIIHLIINVISDLIKYHRCRNWDWEIRWLPKHIWCFDKYAYMIDQSFFPLPSGTHTWREWWGMFPRTAEIVMILGHLGQRNHILQSVPRVFFLGMCEISLKMALGEMLFQSWNQPRTELCKVSHKNLKGNQAREVYDLIRCINVPKQGPCPSEHGQDRHRKSKKGKS